MIYQNKEMIITEAPSAAQLTGIKNDIGENDERLKISENLLYQWIDCTTHFPKNYDKDVVRNFLRGSKYSIEKAKKKLEHHFMIKNLYPAIFSDRSPWNKEIVTAMKTVTMVPLSKLTEDGHRLFIFKFNEIDPSKMEMLSIIKLFFIIYDIILRTPYPVAGDIAIFDYAGSTPGHMIKFLSPTTKTLITILRQAYAIRLKKIHIVNTTTNIDRILSFIKPLLHQKVRHNIILHENHQSVFEYFGDILPSNYGGKNKSLKELMEDCKEVLYTNSKWLEEQESVKINSSIPKELETTVYFKQQMGLEGCFRKLEID